MAALDKLLQSLIDRKMEALMLEPDSRPRMRRSGLEHDVSSSPLAAPTIEGLLGQIAPEGVIAESPAPGRAATRSVVVLTTPWAQTLTTEPSPAGGTTTSGAAPTTRPSAA